MDLSIWGFWEVAGLSVGLLRCVCGCAGHQLDPGMACVRVFCCVLRLCLSRCLCSALCVTLRRFSGCYTWCRQVQLSGLAVLAIVLACCAQQHHAS